MQGKLLDMHGYYAYPLWIIIFQFSAPPETHYFADHHHDPFYCQCGGPSVLYCTINIDSGFYFENLICLFLLIWP